MTTRTTLTPFMSFGENNMMKILFVGGLLISSASYGGEQTIHCPTHYPVQDMKLADVPQGWDGHGVLLVGGRLKNAGAIDGPSMGETRFELRGSDEKTKEGYEHRFVFGSKEKWVFCWYGGDVELFHRVAAEANVCVAKYRREQSDDGPEITITCK